MSTDTTGAKTRPPSKRKTRAKTRDAADAARDIDELDEIELIAAVCNHLLAGLSMPQIARALNKDYPNLGMTREGAYPLIRKAARSGWLKFHPPEYVRWTKMLRESYRWLESVRVVHTATASDVAQHGAESLLALVKRHRLASERNEIHIGFSGGHAMRVLARAFADLVWAPTDDLPDTLVIHAMAAGFDPRDPTMDPNTFFSYFKNGRLNETKIEFLGLAAPLLVKSDGMRVVRDQPDIAEAFASVRDIDIIVASGSDWLDPHSAFRNLMRRSPESEMVLEEEGVVADIAWRPFGKQGPIERETSVRALTLVELSDLPGLIGQEKKVLLTLGPCGLCNAPKGRLLATLLGQPTPLLTDLVVDSRSVAQMLRLKAAAREN